LAEITWRRLANIGRDYLVESDDLVKGDCQQNPRLLSELRQVVQDHVIGCHMFVQPLIDQIWIVSGPGFNDVSLEIKKEKIEALYYR